MKHVLCALLVLVLVCSASAATRNNDDSCDIAVLPAATLLLPYFEVDLDDPSGETTIIAITNVGNLDAIARVTLWTDRAYPVITFNVYLTGYDVQSLNLYDVIKRGIIAPDAGTGTAITRRGMFSDLNIRLDLAGCARLGGMVDDSTLLRMQSAFTEGSISGDCAHIGGGHDNAVGYATIDVVGNCSSTPPTEPSYWTTDIRYDNVLIGDYRQIDSTRNLAQGGPLVHIRAVPEGGTPSGRRASSSVYDAGFPRTFYARYQSKIAPDLDGRQPLPSQFATRWIQGGSGDYETALKIWREGRTGGDAACSEYVSEEALAVREIVVFDEQENAVGSGKRIELAAASRTGVDESEVFPQLANGVTSGWIYLNLDRSGRDELASQAWVISSMRAQSTYSTDIDGIALGNGCSAPAEKSEISLARGGVIAPASNESLAHGRVATTNNDDSCDIALLPAATLLLPYFEVEFGPPTPPNVPPPTNRDPTLFTITNVSPNDQIARVTLWTDFAFPVLTFNIFLTGYDVQSINLEDIIRHGVIAPDEGTGTRVTERGAWSDRNRALDTSACGQLPGRLPQAYVERMQSAFIRGEVPDMGDLQGCDSIGEEHDNAIGYATIDVVRNCSSNTPFSDEYWTNDLAWDNVLIGDYQHVDPYNASAGGGPMVHIRAVPEGGTSTDRRTLPRKYDAGFQRTFYARYQPARAPRFDGRQPLPSVFAARWIDDRQSTRTSLRIWREGRPGRIVTCSDLERSTCGPNWAEIISMDESENAVGYIQMSRIGTCSLADDRVDLPATSRTSVRDTSFYEVLGNGAVSGWIYLNLDNTTMDSPLPSSNWVISSIATDGRYSVDIDAAAFGNGCSLQEPISEVTEGTQVIGPLPNENP